jgi:phage tail tape-measure protein
MTTPPDDDKFSSDPIGKIAKYVGGAMVGFAAMFGGTFIGSAASFEQKLVQWAIPLVGVIGC